MMRREISDLSLVHPSPSSGGGDVNQRIDNAAAFRLYRTLYISMVVSELVPYCNSDQ